MLNQQNLRSGEEQFEEFKHNGKTHIQYDFRDQYGNLFSTFDKTVEQCRDRRNTWTINKHLEIEKMIRSQQGRATRFISA